MAIRQYNGSTGGYETPSKQNVNEYMQPNRDSTIRNQQITKEAQDSINGNSPDTTTTRWSDYLRKMYANGQATGYQGGGGYNPKQLEFSGFSDEYNKYRTDQRGRIEAYMDNPRGYNDQEFSMMQGRNVDSINAQGGGYRQMMQDALQQGGMSSGSLYSGLDKSAQNTQSAIANAQRDLALQDMDLRRQQQQTALGLGNQWAGQMTSDDRWLSEGQMSVDRQNEQARVNAINSANANRRAWDNQQLALQNKIGQMDIDERRYNDDQAWRWRGYGDDNRYINKPQDYV